MSVRPNWGDVKDTCVSGVMPIHNEEKVLGEVLDSVLRQTRPLDELVLVSDRCTDGSRTVARRGPHEEVAVDLGNTGEAVSLADEPAHLAVVPLPYGMTRAPLNHPEQF